jgi:hypothetical protein
MYKNEITGFKEGGPAQMAAKAMKPFAEGET